MFRFFKRGQQALRTVHPGIQHLKGRLDRWQRKVSLRIQRRLERLSPKALTMWLMGFCIASSSVCAYLLITAISPALFASRASPVRQGRPSPAISMDTVFVYPDSFNNKSK